MSDPRNWNAEDYGQFEDRFNDADGNVTPETIEALHQLESSIDDADEGNYSNIVHTEHPEMGST